MNVRPASRSTFTGHSFSEEWIDLRLVSIMRLMLASSTLMVAVISAPPSPPLHFEPGVVVLIFYTVYSAVVYFLSVRQSNLVPAIIMHWLDVGWYVVLIATNGTASIYFNFFFFAILVASFGWGYSTGLYLTLTSAALFTAVALWIAPGEQAVELNRILLRPIQLLILGYLISRWGGFRINLRNQLQLLKGVTGLSHTRFGINRTITSILESLRRFYDADGCLLLLPAHEVDGKFTYQMYRVRRGTHPTGVTPPEINAEAANLFLFPKPHNAVTYRRRSRGEPTLFNVETGEVTRGFKAAAENVANALETTSYLSIPVPNGNRPAGRLYVVGGRQTYTTAEIDFVLQLMGHVTPSIENIRLVDSLASYAADEERRRIARDIHDSVIQPYVGLQLGIAALAQKLQSGNDHVLENVEELLDLTTQELVELRRYVWGLREGEERRDVLIPAIERFVSRFTSVTGIRVEVNARGKIEINDRLAAELFQMVTEGLSNVRRHALCNDAAVDLSCRNGRFQLQIRNPRPPINPFDPEDGHDHQRLFTPKSISERAAMLGGKTVVRIDKNNYTVVSVTIPL